MVPSYDVKHTTFVYNVEKIIDPPIRVIAGSCLLHMLPILNVIPNYEVLHFMVALDNSENLRFKIFILMFPIDIVCHFNNEYLFLKIKSFIHCFFYILQLYFCWLYFLYEVINNKHFSSIAALHKTTKTFLQFFYHGYCTFQTEVCLYFSVSK